MTDAREYGRALYMLAEEENRCDEIRTDAEAVREILRDNPESIKLLDILRSLCGHRICTQRKF